MSPKASLGLTRRELLKLLGASTATPAFGGPGVVSAGGASPEADTLGLLIDTTRCVGCRACQRACSQANNLAPQQPVDLGGSPGPPRQWLSAQVWTVVDYRVVKTPKAQHQTWRTVKRQCMHCLEPACASVCPVGALYKTQEGPVIYRSERCMGCRYCMIACPFDVPKFDWQSGLPLIGKCTLCAPKLAAGLKPACVEACPTGALRFGRRDQLLQKAQARIKAMPDRYFDHIYGEHEVGGTSILYLADVPFEQLGFRTDLGTEPLLDLTWRVMSKIPFQPSNVSPHGPPSRPHGLSGLSPRGDSPALRPGKAIPHLAPHHLLAASLGDV